MNEYILTINNISKRYGGIRAVDNVSASFEKCSLNALIGPNGSGKTTLLNLISGFTKPDNGNICFGKKQITALFPNKIALLGISRTFQKVRIFPQITVIENMMLATSNIHNESLISSLFLAKSTIDNEKKNREKAFFYLKMVGLEERHSQPAIILSRGQQKLLELARALATEPDLLLLDEPVSGVLPDIRNKISDVLLDVKSKGKTVIFIEHDMSFALKLAEKVIVLDFGKKIADDIAENVIKDNKVIEAYFGKEY